MKAIVQDRFGLPDVLEMRDIDTPAVAEGEVLIRVAAAAINPADWAFMRGVPYLFRPMYGLTKPRNPVRGSDVAGTVVAVGNGVTRFQPRRRGLRIGTWHARRVRRRQGDEPRHQAGQLTASKRPRPYRWLASPPSKLCGAAKVEVGRRCW